MYAIRSYYDCSTEKAIQKAFQLTERAPKQQELLMTVISLSGGLKEAIKLKAVNKKELLEKSGASQSALNELVKKEILQMQDNALA